MHSRGRGEGVSEERVRLRLFRPRLSASCGAPSRRLQGDDGAPSNFGKSGTSFSVKGSITRGPSFADSPSFANGKSIRFDNKLNCSSREGSYGSMGPSAASRRKMLVGVSRRRRQANVAVRRCKQGERKTTRDAPSRTCKQRPYGCVKRLK